MGSDPGMTIYLITADIYLILSAKWKWWIHFYRTCQWYLSFLVVYCLVFSGYNWKLRLRRTLSSPTSPAQRTCSPPLLPLHLWSQLVFIDSERKLTHTQISCGVLEGEPERGCLYLELRDSILLCCPWRTIQLLLSGVWANNLPEL